VFFIKRERERERERDKERESFLKHFPFSLHFAQNTSKIYKVLLDKARWKIWSYFWPIRTNK